jgi:hypothetical protein
MCGRFYRQNRASGGTVRHVVTDGNNLPLLFERTYRAFGTYVCYIPRNRQYC